MNKTKTAITCLAALLLAGCAAKPPVPSHTPGPYTIIDAQGPAQDEIEPNTPQTPLASILAPFHTIPMTYPDIAAKLQTLETRGNAFVILENYTERPKHLGPDFLDRSTRWLMVLRPIGYQHITFLRGNAEPDTNGLEVLATYQ